VVARVVVLNNDNNTHMHMHMHIHIHIHIHIHKNTHTCACIHHLAKILVAALADAAPALKRRHIPARAHVSDG